ncbi:alpha and gamma adaptin binding protein p34 domain-containing protein [Sarocladium implicatum]|nr:alpha and gamma adaptin binding protein p34 domain-containing protein [Sarocladium implicatum]
MGKYTDEDPLPQPSPSPALGESSSAISLGITPTSEPPIQRYFDDDPTEFDADDLPPLYTEHDRDNVPQVDPLLPSGAPRLAIDPFRTDYKTGISYFIDRRLDTDHGFLLDQLSTLSLSPPRPYVHLRGTHYETVKNGDKTEKKEMVDFDIEIELTSLLYTDPDSHNLHRLTTVSNFEKVRRGTVLATRAPGFGGSGAAEEGVPDVEQWCMRYVLSQAGLKCFTFERRVADDWDWGAVKAKLLNMIRETNYRGRTTIDFPVRNARVEMYNDCRTNRWRLTKWIEMLCTFTLMFLFTWPWLFFRTKRWDTVYSTWHIGKNAQRQRGRTDFRNLHTMDEDEWFAVWGRAIHQAVMKRRQGLLEQSDLTRAQGQMPREEGFAGVVQAGVEAMDVVNRSFGWGDLTGSNPEPASTSLAGTTHDLSIKTSYYTATVPIWLDLIASPNEWAASFLSEEAGEVLAVLGGLIVVFAIPLSADEAKTKELIEEVGKVVKRGLGGWSWDGVGVAVGIGEAENVEEWDGLCAEAGLEFVQVTGKTQTGRNEFGEKSGIPRVKEALESNDWAQLDTGSLSDFGDFEGESDKEDDPENMDFGYDKTDFEGLKRAIWENSLISDGQDAAGGKEKDMAVNDKDEKSRDHPEGDEDKSKAEVDDDDVMRVERMMSKLQAVREAGQGMSEEQRKRMAARAVQEVMADLDV